MQPIDPYHALPTPGERAQELHTCGTCGVLAATRELHRASLPVPGSLPTTPNAVTYRCRDEAACLARLTHRHRNDAMLTSDDPLYAVGNVLDRLRGDLYRVADDLSAVQDAVGRFRAVHYQGEPDEATIRRVARALAPEMTEPENDSCYRDDAVRAIRAARFDAEAPVPDDHELCRGCHACEDEAEEEALLRAVCGVIWPSFDAHENPAYATVIRRVIRLVRGEEALPDRTPGEAAKLRELADIIGPGFDADAGLRMIRGETP